MADETASTNIQQTKPRRPYGFQPGVSGNPAGRKPGARNKLSEKSIADLHAIYLEVGPTIWRTLAAEYPQKFCELIAKLWPQKIEAEVDVKLSGWLSVVRGADGGGDS